MTHLVLEDHGAFASMRFDGPERLNAFSADTYACFAEELERFAANESWRALIFTGEGRAFCSGQDLGEAGQATTMTGTALRSRLEQLQRITRRMREIPKLFIAAVNGPAAGFGAELTLACDVRFASEDAYFLFPELSRRLYFTNGTLELLPAFGGAALAADLLLSGRRWPATEALAIGFISRILPAAELLDEARRFAEQALSAPGQTMVATLTFLRSRNAEGLERALQHEVETFLAMTAVPAPQGAAAAPATGG